MPDACAVGNPHALGQKPLTFNREVMSLVMSPSLLEHPKVNKLFSAEAVQRAKETLTKARAFLILRILPVSLRLTLCHAVICSDPGWVWCLL